MKRLGTFHWVNYYFWVLACGNRLLWQGSVLTFYHCIFLLSTLFLRICFFAGFWIVYLVLVVIAGGFRFIAYAYFDIVGWLFASYWVSFCGIWVFLILLFSCGFYQLCGFTRFSCDIYSWFSVLFLCSTASEKLVFDYFSKANRLPTIFGLTRYVELASGFFGDSFFLD